jgi:hypothetical protein
MLLRFMHTTRPAGPSATHWLTHRCIDLARLQPLGEEDAAIAKKMTRRSIRAFFAVKAFARGET